MTKHEINVLRMADLLWKKYCRVGLKLALLEMWKIKGDRYARLSALTYTALNTYKQFCKKHSIDISWLKK